jgi:16S rRNA (guanine527-N7)-methyltransferase
VLGSEEITLISRAMSTFGAGVVPEPAACQRLARFFGLLLEWNRGINLTGADSLALLASDHLPDSLALLALVPTGARVVDVGTGGGLPALPFAILRPDCSLTLVEPRAKRAAFLRTAVRELGLAVQVSGSRGEDLAAARPPVFEVAMSRATFAPPAWLALGRRLVVAGGRVLTFVAAPPAELEPPAEAIVYQVGKPGALRTRRLLAFDVPRGTSAQP